MSSAKQEVLRETGLHENSHGRVELESPSFRAGRVSNITIATDFPVSSDVQSVVDRLEAHSTPDTIIEVVEF